VKQKAITPHIPVWDKSTRKDGTFSRFDFTFDKRRNLYICPAGKALTTTGRAAADNGIRYLAAVPDCRACPLKPKCCPGMPSRRIVRDLDVRLGQVRLCPPCAGPSRAYWGEIPFVRVVLPQLLARVACRAWSCLPYLLVVTRKREMPDATFNGSHSRNLVHEAHGLSDHALVAQRPLEYDLSRRNLCVYPESR